MKGYWGRAEATAETIVDGWLYTGDLGYLDDDGFVFIADRKKEMIIRGGVNVYPKEIENAIAEHPAVAAVAVIPEAHDKYGQVAKACVVRVRGEPLEEEEPPRSSVPNGWRGTRFPRPSCSAPVCRETPSGRW